MFVIFAGSRQSTGDICVRGRAISGIAATIRCIPHPHRRGDRRGFDRRLPSGRVTPLPPCPATSEQKGWGARKVSRQGEAQQGKGSDSLGQRTSRSKQLIGAGGFVWRRWLGYLGLSVKGVPLLLWYRYYYGGLLNRTYGTYKNLYISLVLLTIFGPI